MMTGGMPFLLAEVNARLVLSGQASEIRKRIGRDKPIVMSLDLHGILTARMIEATNGFAIYYTYPHHDFADTGARAARLLLKLLRERTGTDVVRVTIPALVRGHELITETGIYGKFLAECKALEKKTNQKIISDSLTATRRISQRFTRSLPARSSTRRSSPPGSGI
jgi:microcystin degradation protein MlrC